MQLAYTEPIIKCTKMVSYYYLFTFYTWGKYNIWQQATHKDSSLRNDKTELKSSVFDYKNPNFSLLVYA